MDFEHRQYEVLSCAFSKDNTIQVYVASSEQEERLASF